MIFQNFYLNLFSILKLVLKLSLNNHMKNRFTEAYFYFIEDYSSMTSIFDEMKNDFVFFLVSSEWEIDQNTAKLSNI